jgi:hypothetical protein
MIATKPEISFYHMAKEHLLSGGFAAEMSWQLERDFGAFSETDLLREAAWVILCSGFRESVVRQRFDFISLCFCDWESASEICSSAAQCRATALAGFGNHKKIDAILGTAALVNQLGFPRLKMSILQDPIHSVQMFPFIGPITAFHLAKNLGYATAKPDRHLARVATALGYSDAQHLCSSISLATGDPVQVVDVVLWRYVVLYGHVNQAAALA